MEMRPARDAAQELHAREAELARVQRIGGIGGFEIDFRDGGFRNRRSPEYLRLHGLTADAADEPHDAWVGRLHPHDRERVEAGFKAALSGPTADYHAEYRIITPQGQRWISAIGEIARDPEGRALQMVGVHIDITRTREAELALHSSTLGLQRVLDTIGEAYYALDGEDRLITASRRALEIWGRSEAEALGRRLGEVVPGVEGGGGYAAMREALRAGKPSRAEVRSISLGGRWVEQDVHPMPGGGAAVAFRDIHGRKLAEQALRASEQRFRAAVQALSGVLWTNDAQGRMVGDQPGWQALTGQAPVGYDGFGWGAAVHPEDLPATLEAWRQAVATCLPYVVEHRVRRHDGAWRLFSVRAVPVRGEAGEVMEWVGVHTDITEEREARETLRRMNETLEARVRMEVQAREATQARLQQTQRLEALGQLAGGVAHDFNNVLQVVQSGIGLIARRASDADAVLRVSGMVREAATRGASVTRRLLAFSRQDELRAQPIDTAGLLHALREMLDHTLGGGIEVRLTIDGALPWLCGDKGQLETVLVNLATNARDAMPQGGCLDIAAVVRQVGEAGFEVGGARLAAGLYVRIAMRDTGTGMSAATLARAAEPFFTTKPVGAGTGLGLSMATGFAAQSGGGLELISRPGHGAEVALWLPEAVGGARPPEITDIRRTDTDWRVLLVAGDAPVWDPLANELEAAGLAVLRATGDAAALALLESGIAVDVLLSDGSDEAALRLVQAARRHRAGLPAILVTGAGGGSPPVMNDATVAVMRKPADAADLVRRIRSLLEGEGDAGAH